MSEFARRSKSWRDDVLRPPVNTFSALLQSLLHDGSRILVHFAALAPPAGLTSASLNLSSQPSTPSSMPTATRCELTALLAVFFAFAISTRAGGGTRTRALPRGAMWRRAFCDRYFFGYRAPAGQGELVRWCPRRKEGMSWKGGTATAVGGYGVRTFPGGEPSMREGVVKAAMVERVLLRRYRYVDGRAGSFTRNSRPRQFGRGCRGVVVLSHHHAGADAGDRSDRWWVWMRTSDDGVFQRGGGGGARVCDLLFGSRANFGRRTFTAALRHAGLRVQALLFSLRHVLSDHALTGFAVVRRSSYLRRAAALWQEFRRPPGNCGALRRSLRCHEYVAVGAGGAILGLTRSYREARPELPFLRRARLAHRRSGLSRAGIGPALLLLWQGTLLGAVSAKPRIFKIRCFRILGLFWGCSDPAAPRRISGGFVYVAMFGDFAIRGVRVFAVAA